jgi:sugar lactone lactonase YvrE
VDVTVLLDGRAYLEAPRWHDGSLFVSDIAADEVLKATLGGVVTVVASRPGLAPSGLGWAPDGTLLVVSVWAMQLWGLSDGTLHEVADLSSVATAMTNDLAVDGRGHAFVGQAGANLPAGEPAPPSPLLRVDPDGSVHRAAEDLMCANGIAVADHGATLLVAETFRDCITAFSLAGDGSLADRRTWAVLPEGSGPDGVCLDKDGALWVACPFHERFLRVEPGGEVVQEVAVRGRRAIACALGGPRGTTLFMVTTRSDVEPAALAEARASRVEMVEVAVPGAAPATV